MNLNSIYSYYTATSTAERPLFISKEAAASFSGVLSNAISQSQGHANTGYDAIFEAAAQKYNVPVNLLTAVAKVESNYRANATSRCGAMGIMQLMPRTAAWLGVQDAYDPEQNIMGGAKYLGMLLKQYDGDVDLTLAAYNAGPGTVRRYGGTVPPFAQGYVDKVKRNIGSDFTANSAGSSVTAFTAASNTPASNEEIKAVSNSIVDDLAEGLPMLLLWKVESEMRLFETINSGRETQNSIFSSDD